MPLGTICTPDHYYTLAPITYPCLVCKLPVEPETITGVDLSGKEFTVYSPASHYYCIKGIFCGPICALKYREI